MNRDKQIEEMAMLVCRHTMTKMCVDGTCPMLWECPLNIKTVEALYDAGYRKSTEVAEDIIRMLRAAGINEWRYPIVADIKKKYTEGEG